MPVIGCVSGCAPSTASRESTTRNTPITMWIGSLGWFDWQAGDATSRVRRHEFLLREPDAGNPPVRFDERDVETKQGGILRHRPSERPGNRYARPTPPRHVSTLPIFLSGYENPELSRRPAAGKQDCELRH